MKIATVRRYVALVGIVVAFLVWDFGGSTLNALGDRKDQSKVKKGAGVVFAKGSTRDWSDANNQKTKKRVPWPRARAALNYKSPRKCVRKSTAIDPVVQRSYTGKTLNARPVDSAMPSPLKSFDGMAMHSGGSTWPSDTNGDVGTTYYIQTVNTSFGIFRKSDGSQVSVIHFNDFFEGGAITGTSCDISNRLDPVVLYDRYAQRWFMMVMAWKDRTDGTLYSIATSKTSDPTGQWWLYCMRAHDTYLAEYAKCGIWHDGIYITANLFTRLYIGSGDPMGSKIWAFKKPEIYNGTLEAQYVLDDTWYAWCLLPANAKGATPPPSSAPNYMYAFDADEWGESAQDVLAVFKFDVDWDTPANTTWTGPTLINTAAFTYYEDYIPQLYSKTWLDDLADRLMYSAMYRNFGTHESVYLCHTVGSNGVTGKRWYEIRVSGGNSSIFQQGTYQPDTHYRWMGSIGADKHGNIAMGYSVSSSTINPGIRYAGRLSTDPANQMSQGEATLIDGSGGMTTFDRWGDYTSLTIDPVDDETFWYTNQYLVADGKDWKTRIGSFKLASAPVPVASDFNSDGRSDILWRSYADGGSNAVWLVGAGGSSPISNTQVTDPQSAPGGATLDAATNTDWKMRGSGDFNNDQKADIIYRNLSTGANAVWYMDGTTRTGSALLDTTPLLDWDICAVGDMNGDGKDDIIWRNYSTGVNAVWFMDGVTRTGSTLLTTAVDTNWKIVGAGDFNGDDNLDLVWRNQGTGQNALWYMDGTTKTGSALIDPTPDTNWQLQAVIDYDGNGSTDLVWRHTGDGRNAVWYMTGATKTGTALLTQVTNLNWKMEN